MEDDILSTMTLRRTVRQTHRSGSYVPAVVESISLGYATVRLSPSGARLTNLPVFGAAVSVGDRVYVDYTAGVQPSVRKAGTMDLSDLEAIDLTVAELDVTPTIIDPVEETITAGADLSFSIWSSVQQQISAAERMPIQFNNEVFDTADFFDIQRAVTNIKLPADGLYFIVGQIGILTSASVSVSYPYIAEQRHYHPITLELEGSEYGIFAVEQGYPLLSYSSVPGTVEVSGFINGLADETVTLWVTNGSGYVITSELDPDHTYPSLYGFRAGGASRGELIDQENIQEEEFPPVASPITEINNESGTLAVFSDGDYARGIANVDPHSNEVLTIDVRFVNSTGNGRLSLYLRSSNDWYDDNTPSDGYEAALDGSGSVALYRVVNGSRTLLDSMAGSYSELWHDIKFEVNGNYIRFKRWLSSESEPGSWDMEVNDTGGFTTAGGFQVCLYSSTGSHEILLDNALVTSP